MGKLSPEKVQELVDRDIAKRRVEAVAPDLLAICLVFLGHDERFRVAVGGNPLAVDRMLDAARAVVAKATGGQP